MAAWSGIFVNSASSVLRLRSRSLVKWMCDWPGISSRRTALRDSLRSPEAMRTQTKVTPRRFDSSTNRWASFGADVVSGVFSDGGTTADTTAPGRAVLTRALRLGGGIVRGQGPVENAPVTDAQALMGAGSGEGFDVEALGVVTGEMLECGAQTACGSLRTSRAARLL